MEVNNTELYEQLEVTPTASRDDLKKAYRKAARKIMHASHGTADENEEFFKRASEAYHILSDENLRKIYDEEGLDGVNRFKEAERQKRNADNIYHTLGPGTGWNRAPSIKSTVYAPLEDFYFGNSLQFEFTRDVLCEACKRSRNNDTTCEVCMGTRVIQSTTTKQIEITPGMDDEASIYGARMGSQAPGKETGDMIIIVKQLEHVFKRQGSKLILDVSLPLSKFTNGFEIIFQHLGDYVVAAKSEPNIALRDGDLFEIKNEGMPKKHQKGQYGDLYLRFHDNDGKDDLPKFASDIPIYGNTVSLISEMPCEQRLRHASAQKVDEIPEAEEAPGCVQQ